MSRLIFHTTLRACVASAAMFASVVSADTWYGTAFSIGDGFTYVTNEHVVNGARTICFRTPSGQAGRAKVVSSDKADDLVILRGNLYSPPLLIGTSQEIEKGMNVVAIGYPVPSIMGLEAKVTEGIVNALTGVGGDRRRFQISASIQPGNSGGPLLNENGRVIGVVVSRLGKRFTEATGQIADSVGYGIHIARLRALFETTPPLSQYLSSGSTRQTFSKTKLISQAEPSVVLVVASDKNETCANDYDIEIPEFGARAKTRQEADRERLELEKIAQARVAQERTDSERRERELAASKAEDERRKIEAQKNKEDLDDKRRLAVKNFVNDLEKRFPSLRFLENSPGFCAWQSLIHKTPCINFEEFESPEKIESIVKNYASALGVSESELINSFTADIRDKLSGKDFLLLGILSQIDTRYAYGIARFNRLDKKISHLLIRSNSGRWHVIQPSKTSTSSISFNIPSGVLFGKDADVFGVDESHLKTISISK